jgi:hypothetical protein
MAARMLIIGIWTEAWDDGVFEWKPLTLKMRIFPADSITVEPLLSELVEAGVVCVFERDGKRLGAIRNFCKFQRPKKPNSSGNIPDHIKQYVALEARSSEPVPNQYGTSSEIGPQMEDGGCNRREIDKSISKNITPPEPSPVEVLSECLSEQTARDVVEHRKKLRKPMTARAARELAKSFLSYGNAEAAASAMIANGWQGFNPAWMDSSRNRTGPPQSQNGKTGGWAMLSMKLKELENEAEDRSTNAPILELSDYGRPVS